MSRFLAALSITPLFLACHTVGCAAPVDPNSAQADSAPAAAESAAGWVKYEGNPVLGSKLGTCFNVSLLREGDTYRMWFSWRPKASVALSESSDGIHWSEPQIVLGPNKATDWEADMFYVGFRDEDHAQIGLARSKDGISGWQRHPANPILRPGREKWDHDACYKPFAMLAGNRWLLWYNGRRGGTEQIGLARHEGDDLGFGAN